MMAQENPWADRWESMATGSDDPAMMRWEADEARAHDTQVCPEGHVAFYRPGVGGWWCKEGHLSR